MAEQDQSRRRRTKGVRAGAIRFDKYGRIIVDSAVQAEVSSFKLPPWLGGPGRGGGGGGMVVACPDTDLACVPESACADAACVPEGACADAACVPEGACADAACVPEGVCADVLCEPEAACPDTACGDKDSLCADIFCRENETCQNDGCEINLECGGGEEPSKTDVQ